MNNENEAKSRYDETGEYVPYTSSHGNINGDLAYLRDVYMVAEKDYFIKLLENNKIREYFISLIYQPADALFNAAIKLQDRLENGELETEAEKAEMAKMSSEEAEKLHMKNLEDAEGEICLLLAAARDKAKLLELVKIPHYEKEESYSMDSGFSRSR